MKPARKILAAFRFDRAELLALKLAAKKRQTTQAALVREAVRRIIREAA